MVNIILYTKNGQLGNRLIQFGSFVAFADEYDVKIWYPALEDYANVFQVYQKSLLPSYPESRNHFPPSIVKPIRRLIFKIIYFLTRVLNKLMWRESDFHKFVDINESDSSLTLNQGFFNTISDKNFVFIKNWEFRVDTYSEDSLKSVIKTTRFLSSYYLKANELISEARSKDTLIFGVHIRRGDYQNFEGGRFFYSLSNYLNWMRQIKALIGKNVVFILSSNEDIKDSKELMVGDLVIKHSQGNLIIDLITLSNCDYLIGPPSTFSMWASFIGNTPLQMIRSADHILKREYFKIYKPDENHL